MENLEAASFSGPRAYFTSFDYRIASRTGDHGVLVRSVERRLKILLMTKAHVVCAATHLSSPVAAQLFQANPVLLRNGLVVPALRRDKASITDAIESKIQDHHAREEWCSFYEDNVAKAVRWDHLDNAQWFRDSFVQELSNEQSVLRRNLAGEPSEAVEQLRDAIAASGAFERSIVETESVGLSSSSRQVLTAFRDLLYHMSGARVVNCESALPQENYIDYSLTDLESRQTQLADEQIFWKIFVEMAFETMQNRQIPIEVLDMLSFEDIEQIRAALTDCAFQENYDSVVRACLQAMERGSWDEILLSAESVLSGRDRLERIFSEILDKELAIILKHKRRSARMVAVRQSVSLGLGVAGLFSQLVSAAMTLKGLSETAPVLISNLSSAFTPRGAKSIEAEYRAKKDAALRAAVAGTSGPERAVLVEGLEIVMKGVGSRLSVDLR